jgi:hypothetical protein
MGKATAFGPKVPLMGVDVDAEKSEVNGLGFRSTPRLRSKRRERASYGRGCGMAAQRYDRLGVTTWLSTN